MFDLCTSFSTTSFLWPANEELLKHMSTGICGRQLWTPPGPFTPQVPCVKLEGDAGPMMLPFVRRRKKGVSFVKRWSKSRPFHSSGSPTLLTDLWNDDNFCETWTTSWKRWQLLWIQWHDLKHSEIFRSTGFRSWPDSRKNRGLKSSEQCDCYVWHSCWAALFGFRPTAYHLFHLPVSLKSTFQTEPINFLVLWGNRGSWGSLVGKHISASTRLKIAGSQRWTSLGLRCDCWNGDWSSASAALSCGWGSAWDDCWSEESHWASAAHAWIRLDKYM